MSEVVSIAIETSCRCGGVALGRGSAVIAEVVFDASQRHATHLVTRLKEMLSGVGLAPADVDELYISAGPGSFTGLRVGITVARTFAQAMPRVRCVAVPTAEAVAQNAIDLPWRNLGVVIEVGEGCVYGCCFARGSGGGMGILPVRPAGVSPASSSIESKGGQDARQTLGPEAQATPGAVVTPAEFLTAVPRPITLIGEALSFHDFAVLAGSDVTLLEKDSPLNLPTAVGVWHVGRRMAAAGQFTEYHHLLPIYSRKPEALCAWERKQGKTGD